MFKGQPQKPKFDVGELVHLKWTPQSPSTMVKGDDTSDSAAAASISRPPPAHFLPRERVAELKVPDIAGNAALKALIRPELVWRIKDFQASTSDQREHTYTLVPTQLLRLKTAESSLIKAPFEVSELVVAKKEKDRLFRVEQLMLYEQGVRVEVVDEIGIREWLWASELEKAQSSEAWRPM